MISPDSPITRAGDDRLGRSAFAKALANAVLEFEGDDSFVVGVHGKWGTGKSSVLNLFASELTEASAKRSQPTDVLRFNPWNFSDQNQLVLQFFRQFSAHLRKLDKTGKTKIKTLLENLDEYSSALAPPLEAIPYGKVFSTGLRFVTKTFAGNRDIDSLFTTVSNELRQMKRKTVVIIDDIDRLTATEIRQVFQLVKLSARFPYVVYVLAFDRDAVTDALSELGVSSGEEYLEKIVQVSFDLPPITEQMMNSMLSAAIEKIVTTYPSANFDNHRFGNLFHSGFRRSFQSLRDIRRFINGLEFGFGMIAREVNGVDFIGVEALRVFYPKVYDVIRQNKKIVAGYIDDVTREEGPDAFKASVDEMFKSGGANIEECKELILELFPKLEYAYAKTLRSSDTHLEKALRVSATRYFDYYFQLVVPEGQLSIVEVETTAESARDQSELIQNLIHYIETDRIKVALESFRPKLKALPSEQLPSVLGALLDIGDRVKLSGSMIAGHLPEYMYVSWAVFDVIDLLPPERRSGVLEECCRTTDGVGTAADTIDTIQAAQKRDKDKYGEFDDAALGKIRGILAERIKQVAQTDRFLDRDFLPKILFFWKTWGDPPQVSTYIANVFASPKNFLRFLDKFIYQTTVVGGGDKVARIQNKLNIRALAEVTDIDVITSRIVSIDKAQLSSHEQLIAETATKYLHMFKKSGLSPKEFREKHFFGDDEE
jgi:predicted KAP-like P-loop ATPase